MASGENLEIFDTKLSDQSQSKEPICEVAAPTCELTPFMALKLFKQGFVGVDDKRSNLRDQAFLRLKYHRMVNTNACTVAKVESKIVPNTSLKSRCRQSQSVFRTKLIARDKVCVISKMCAGECEAAHIIDYASGGSFDVSNGLLMSRNLHKQFDMYLFSIDPETCKVVVAPEAGKWSISFYTNKKATIDDLCKPNLKAHYEKFKIKNNL
jgi:hypothetical protein